MVCASVLYHIIIIILNINNVELSKMEQISQMGLEYELQLMIETAKGLQVVRADDYLEFVALPQCITFDLGNIEIATPPRENYEEAVKSANYLLYEKLIPFLINDFGIKKFALFLPYPMCRFPDKEICCLKHWNISINIDKELSEKYKNYLLNGESIFIFEYIMNKIYNSWKYDYKMLLHKGFPTVIKDIETPYDSRVHIKLPYHYVPIESNPDLLPFFNDTFISPDRWKNLVCYYKNNVFTKIRDLV